MELISIIMPAYNAGNFIEASINSVQNQTYSNWELLIIDDGSTDCTREISEKFTELDPRIKLISQENKKQASARNNGIKNASGSWIAFLDSDDLWHPNKLHKQIEISDEFPTVDVIYTDGWIFNDDNLDNLTPYPTITGKIIHGKEMYLLEYNFNYIPVLGVLVRRHVIDKIGLQDERRTFNGCEDWDYWLRMSLAGVDFYGISEKLFYYRRHSNNTSGNYINMLLANVSVFIKNFEPQYFSEIEGRNLFKKTVFPLINALIREKRFDDISFILDGVLKVSPLNSYKYIRKIIDLLGERSLFPVAVIGKLERLLI